MKFDANRYSAEYMKENYDRIAVFVPKGDKEKIRAYAESLGMSVNQLMVESVRRAMGDENPCRRETAESESMTLRFSSAAAEKIRLAADARRRSPTQYVALAADRLLEADGYGEAEALPPPADPPVKTPSSPPIKELPIDPSMKKNRLRQNDGKTVRNRRFREWPPK